MKIIKTIDELKRLVSVLMREKELTFDVESTGLSPHDNKILLVTLSTRAEDYVIDFTYIPLEQMELLRPIFESDSILKIGFNLTFDGKMLLAHNITLDPVFDCMIADSVVLAGLYVPGVKGKTFSLEAVAHRRLGIPMEKAIRNTFIGYEGQGFEYEQYKYAADDCKLLWPIYDQQVQEIKEKELEYTIYTIEMPLVKVTALMEYQGVPIDIEALEELRDPFKRYADACYRALQDAFISSGAADRILFQKDETGKAYYTAINPNSKPGKKKNKETGEEEYREGQMVRALRTVGIDLQSLSAKEIIKWDFKNSRRKEGLAAISYLDLVDDTEIADALEKYGGLDNPYLRLYMFYNGATKLLGTYIEGTLEKVDRKRNRLYGWYKQVGARATGRYSSNMQQFPKDERLERLGLNYSIRKCFVAPKGRRFLIADFSQIELAILADRALDDRLSHENREGDVHLVVTHATLGKFFPIALEVTKKNKKEHPYALLRDASKVISYGIAYGVSGKSLAEQMNLKLGSLNIKVTPEQGDEMIRLWKSEAFPASGKYLDETSEKAVTLGYSVSALGRKRFYDLESIQENIWRERAARREAANQSVQSSSVDMTKLSMLYCYETLDRKKGRIVASVHDELLLEVTNSYVDTAKQILKESMERAARDVLPRVGKYVVVDPDDSQRYDK